MTGAPVPGGWRLASPATALAVAGLVLALMVAEVPFTGLAHQSLLADGGSLPLTVSAPFWALGGLLAWRRPGNPIGWLILGLAGFAALSEAASFYAVADYRLHAGHLPLGWLALLAQPGWAPAVASSGLMILLFPDGRLPSPRWRWALWPYLTLALLWIAGALWFTASVLVAHQVRIDASGNLMVLAHPAGGAAWWGAAGDGFFLLLLLSWLASLAGQALSYRSSSGERRQQLKWLLAGAAASLVGLLASFRILAGLGLPALVTGLLASLCLLALPASITVGILKYRLFDIDRLISRTLAYALLTGLLVGIYAGLVLLATQVLRFSSPVAVAASTLTAAALFTPLRRWLQRLVDRRFNRARYDADRMVDAFAGRLQDAVDLDTVRTDLTVVVRGALEPSQVSVWMIGGRP
ncbi:MAG TPA: hypothetical protein VIF35_07450 [Streptosporangiaceae bacterium]